MHVEHRKKHTLCILLRVFTLGVKAGSSFQKISQAPAEFTKDPGFHRGNLQILV